MVFAYYTSPRLAYGKLPLSLVTPSASLERGKGTVGDVRQSLHSLGGVMGKNAVEALRCFTSNLEGCGCLPCQGLIVACEAGLTT